MTTEICAVNSDSLAAAKKYCREEASSPFRRKLFTDWVGMHAMMKRYSVFTA